ncbi:MAG: hypothetical protein AB7E47_15445 [Desulfovibrionaceae bacterium]
MQFTCPCGLKQMNIPDQNLPAADKFAMKCPFCQKKMLIDKTNPQSPARFMDELGAGAGQAASAQAAPPSAPVPPAPPAAPAAGTPQAAAVPPPPPAAAPAVSRPNAPSGAGGEEPEIFPPGAKVAFVRLFDAAWTQRVMAFLDTAGFHHSEAADAGKAVQKLRLNEYALVILEDGGDNAALLEEIGSWSGLRRREVNLVLVGAAASSMDPQMAFQRGLNSYIHTADATRADTLLADALKGYERYYELLHLAKAKVATEG